MGIVPNGSPAWTRSVDFSHYDGNVDKQNYLSQGVVDPLTDVGAEGFSRMTSDLAACVRVAPFCELMITTNDTTPAAPTIQRAYMQTGIRLTPYAGDAAPANFPSASRVGIGEIILTFPASFVDEYGVAGAFEISCPHGNLYASAGIVMVEILTPQTVRVEAVYTDGSPAPDAVIRFSCFSGN